VKRRPAQLVWFIHGQRSFASQQMRHHLRAAAVSRRMQNALGVGLVFA
jgi:hypothetical protein